MMGKVFKECYELQEQIGQGGMSIVFWVYDWFIGCVVVVKVVSQLQGLDFIVEE